MQCNGCAKELRWTDVFPGDICVDCHRKAVDGQDATKAYNEMMGTFGQGAGPQKIKKKAK